MFIIVIQTGKTAFQHAISNNSYDCMRYLVLQCGVDPDEPDEVSGAKRRVKMIQWITLVQSVSLRWPM